MDLGAPELLKKTSISYYLLAVIIIVSIAVTISVVNTQTRIDHLEQDYKDLVHEMELLIEDARNDAIKEDERLHHRIDVAKKNAREWIKYHEQIHHEDK